MKFLGAAAMAILALCAALASAQGYRDESLTVGVPFVVPALLPGRFRVFTLENIPLPRKRALVARNTWDRPCGSLQVSARTVSTLLLATAPPHNRQSIRQERCLD
jgi:hypothetical protein